VRTSKTTQSQNIVYYVGISSIVRNKYAAVSNQRLRLDKGVISTYSETMKRVNCFRKPLQQKADEVINNADILLASRRSLPTKISLSLFVSIHPTSMRMLVCTVYKVINKSCLLINYLSTISFFHSFIHSSMTLQPFVGL
jgi:hypothetical protein